MSAPEKFNSARGFKRLYCAAHVLRKSRTASTPFTLGWTPCLTALDSGKWPRKCDIDSAFLPTLLSGIGAAFLLELPPLRCGRVRKPSSLENYLAGFSSKDLVMLTDRENLVASRRGATASQRS
jgi:hypothetical protein